jgi:hypothetical protein
MKNTPCEIEGCSGHLVILNESFQLKSKIVGDVTIPSIEQYKCNKCDYTELSAQSTDSILDYVRTKEKEAINSLPIGEFVSATHAAEILECSRQAFNHNPRIRRGFILAAEIDGKMLYHKRSVELFKKTKDGRFPAKKKEQTKFAVLTGITGPTPHYNKPITREELYDDVWKEMNLEAAPKHNYLLPV